MRGNGGSRLDAAAASRMEARKGREMSMSGSEDGGPPSEHGRTPDAVRPRVTARRLLAVLLALAWLHGSLYAGLMPPWGLIDEAQHVDYIQSLAEGRGQPIVGETYLSPEIIDSHFATRRWETFLWTAPATADPAAMGLAAHSYEAYQPPLFYWLMTPIYWALPGDILDKLFGLRWVMVTLSLIPVWVVFWLARRLRPDDLRFAGFATLLYISLPERTMAVSRVNNDVLLEIWAALALMVLTVGAAQGMTRRDSLLLGVLIGAGVWTKASAVFLLGAAALVLWQQPRAAARALIARTGVVVTVLGMAALIRNLALYGDATGFAGFRAVHDVPFTPGPLTELPLGLATAIHHTFLVWWKGSDAATNPLVTGFYWLMTLVVVAAVVQAARRARGATGRVLLVYGAVVALYLTATLASYYAAMIPVTQGRFLLPAMAALALLMAWGLWEASPWAVVGVTGVLAAMDAISLFGNLLPFHYYWSGIVTGKIPAGLPLMGRVAATVGRLLADKPGWVAAVIPALPVLYALGWVAALAAVARLRNPARSALTHAVDAPLSLRV